MKSFATPLVWKGILGLVVGVIAVAWPGITIGAFVILFALYAFIAAGMEAGRAFRSASARPVIGHLVLAALGVAAGVAALTWPQITALSLVLLVAVWAFTTGILEVALAFAEGESAGERALLALSGLVSVALAVVLVIRPDVGAVVLAQVYGLFSIVVGVSSLVMAANLRRGDRAVRPSPNSWDRHQQVVGRS